MTAPRTVRSIAGAVRDGASSAVETVRSTLARIEACNDQLNCFREVYEDHALERAGDLDVMVAAGTDPGPLAGVPIAVKDNIASTQGTTACGSRMLEGYRSPFTATAVARLEAAGAIVIGRTNCDEFAMGSSTEHCAYGPVRNPWDPARVPGGSSGGSAAAVAAGLVPAALGSDTGGSVRQPASLCGVVGVKPSYGRVSRYGLVAFGSSLDQIGPITATVEDAALLLQIMAGFDAHDATCSDEPVPDFAATLDRGFDGLRLGVPREYLSDANDPAVNRVVHRAIETLGGPGAEIVELDLPLTDYGIATYYILAPAEASSNLARYDGIRYGRRAAIASGEDLFDLYARSRSEGFGAEVQRRIMLGTYVLSSGYYDAFYKSAMKARRLIRRVLDEAFDRCHALIGPVAPTAAFEIGAKSDPMSMYLCDVYTAVTSIAGICAISVPAGFDEHGDTRLPVGVQIQCRAFDEATMFRVAATLERAAGVRTELPPIAAGG